MSSGNATGVHGVAQPIPLNSMNCFRSPEADPSTGCGVGEQGEAMFTISKTNHHAVAQPISIQDVRPVEKAQNGKGWNDDGTAYTVDTHATQGVAQPVAFAQNTRDEVRWINGDGAIAGALAAQPGMKQTTYVAQTISIHPHCIGRSPEAGPQGKEYLMDGSAYCMDSRGQPQAVAHPIGLDEEQNAMVNRFGTLKARMAGGGFEGSVMQANMQVRRLTPVECERLQGFPDDYTAIPWRGKEAPDGPRYKALGNSMAVPVMQWIGGKINAE